VRITAILLFFSPFHSIFFPCNFLTQHNRVGIMLFRLCRLAKLVCSFSDNEFLLHRDPFSNLQPACGSNLIGRIAA
jgi:hypothetical protein